MSDRPLGSSKADRQLIDFTRKEFGQKSSDKLREFERNAKRQPSEECQLCLKFGDKLFPEIFWMCSQCTKKHAERYGSIFIWAKRDYVYPVFKKMCNLCTGLRITFFQVNVRVCPKCAKRIGKAHSKDVTEEVLRSGKKIETVSV